MTGYKKIKAQLEAWIKYSQELEDLLIKMTGHPEAINFQKQRLKSELYDIEAKKDA